MHQLKNYASRMRPRSKQIDWLTRGDYFNKGIESWILSWKDMAKKLIDMGMPLEADRLQQKFQKANAHINADTTTFLLPKSLSDENTLNDMIA